ncbi:ferrichrome-binding periplasmic protein [Actinobacillus equuli]|nr:ferrichrome-binding periplasmic protein [Actinobacillus equuli]
MVKTLAVIFGLFFAMSCGVKAKSFATLDWTVAETLIALGEKPVAVGDVKVISSGSVNRRYRMAP